MVEIVIPSKVIYFCICDRFELPMAENSESLNSALLDGSRKIVVCKNDIDLSKKNENTIFILFVEESQGSAGVG